ncbi:LysR family glycine cleavage system transcriptional activator [Variovorax sp. GrIS 2.14]
MTLPRLSLNAMRAFEATARLHSFSAAADELFVTHGAVSRHIRILEDSLGLPLLARSAHGTKPTAEGQCFAEGLSRAFALIQSSVEQLRPGPLTLSCSESIMMYWLIPRLAQFQKTNHGIELRFNMSSGSEAFTRDNSSVALRLSSIDPPKQVISNEVVAEWIGPVCSAQYLRSLQMESAADLTRARLMVSRTRPHAWTDWRRCGTQDIGDLHVDETFDHFFLLIQAARCGLGFINVPRMLVREDLNSGALVAPFGFLAGPNKLSIWVASHLSRRPDTVKLVDWLTDELRAAEQQTDLAAQ